MALVDLNEIADYISLDSPQAARRVINRIEEVCFKLGDIPGMGRPSEVPPALKLTVPPWNYKIVYEIGEARDEVIILRIYHGARDLPY